MRFYGGIHWNCCFQGTSCYSSSSDGLHRSRAQFIQLLSGSLGPHKSAPKQHLDYYYYRFMALCQGLPGWAGTRKIIHLPTPTPTINHPLSASSIHRIPSPCSIHAPNSPPAQSTSKFPMVLSRSGTLHTLPHPIIVFPTAHAHTTTTCPAVVPKLYHLILVSLGSLDLLNSAIFAGLVCVINTQTMLRQDTCIIACNYHCLPLAVLVMCVKNSSCIIPSWSKQTGQVPRPPEHLQCRLSLTSDTWHVPLTVESLSPGNELSRAASEMSINNHSKTNSYVTSLKLIKKIQIHKIM